MDAGKPPVAATAAPGDPLDLPDRQQAAVPSDAEAEAAAAAGGPEEVEDDRVYLVPYTWLKDAQESSTSADAGGGVEAGPAVGCQVVRYTASPSSAYGGPMKIINNLFNSDLVFNLRREEDGSQIGTEEGVSGRCYALIRRDMWCQARKRHRDLKSINTSPNYLDDEGSTDVYSIMLRISVVQDTSVMTIKISKKDNSLDCYKRASKVFSVDTEVRIWDYSGQTTLIFMDKLNKLHKDGQRQMDQEILLELQVYTLLESLVCQSESRRDDIAMQISRKIACCGGPALSNGDFEASGSQMIVQKTSGLNGTFRMSGSSGLAGLENLGNTCFMNSAIQCLAHTPKLVDFFLGDYCKEINHNNPLGMNGELALAFGEVLRKLWAPDGATVIPKLFKSKLAHFAPQFSGFNQHDSQELLAFLLDGLHEDLNRVKTKPYVEVKDALDRSHEEVADEYWENHLARNDSIIVDTCQGQYRSTLVCPICSKVSVTFDPFMYLSLPLPSTTTRSMTLTVFSTDGSSLPSSHTLTVPKHGKCKDLIQSLSTACSLHDNESLLVAEVYSNRIIRYLEDQSDSLSLIRDGDKLVAYRMPKDLEGSPLVVFMHQYMEQDLREMIKPPPKAFGIPFIARLPSNSNGAMILDLFLKLLKPFQKLSAGSKSCESNESNSTFETGVADEESYRDDDTVKTDITEDREDPWCKVELHVTDARGQKMDSKINTDMEFAVSSAQKLLHVLVSWPLKALRYYDISCLSILPEIYKSSYLVKRPQDSVSLYVCLDAFLKEEPLGPEDMWYCPSCKMHQQASKKLDLWRLPEVLVIHLKRFSYSRFMKSKLETLVDFPIHDLDLSSYIAGKGKEQRYHYELFAISNHYGSMGGGHYTAYAHHAGNNQWYDFDDRHVSPIPEDNLKTSAAYLLFYKRFQATAEMEE